MSLNVEKTCLSSQYLHNKNISYIYISIHAQRFCISRLGALGILGSLCFNRLQDKPPYQSKQLVFVTHLEDDPGNPETLNTLFHLELEFGAPFFSQE